MSSDSLRRSYRPRQNAKASTPGRQRIDQRLTKDPECEDAANRVFENQIGYGDPLDGMDVLLSPENAARYLDVGRKFIYELIARNEIEAVRVGDRLRRIRISALDNWLNRST